MTRQKRILLIRACRGLVYTIEQDLKKQWPGIAMEAQKEEVRLLNEMIEQLEKKL